MIRIDIHHYIHSCDADVSAGLRRILSAVDALKELIAMNQDELKTKLQEISDQTTKVFGEVSTSLESMTATIASLQEALANAGNTSPEVDALVASLKSQVTAIDDLIPDTAPPAP